MNTTTTKQFKDQWSPLMNLRNEVDRLMDDFWGMPADHQVSARTWQPACDVVEDQDHYLLSLEMAGIPKDQIKIVWCSQKDFRFCSGLTSAPCSSNQFVLLKHPINHFALLHSYFA